MSMLLLEIVPLGAGMALATMVVDLDDHGARRSAAQEEARAAAPAEW